jgi:hypothetical protein
MRYKRSTKPVRTWRTARTSRSDASGASTLVSVEMRRKQTLRAHLSGVRGISPRSYPLKGRYESPARSTTNRQRSVVECREQFKRVGLLLVMIDKELRLVHCDHLPDFFHRRD